MVTLFLFLVMKVIQACKEIQELKYSKEKVLLLSPYLVCNGISSTPGFFIFIDPLTRSSIHTQLPAVAHKHFRKNREKINRAYHLSIVAYFLLTLL